MHPCPRPAGPGPSRPPGRPGHPSALGVPTGSDAVHAIRLIASELLTNVVLHASPATVRIDVVVELCDGAWIRLGVHDGHPDCPAPADSSAEATSGRGLKIVHALIEELNGVVLTERTDDGGKTVWVELPCPVDEQAAEAEDERVTADAYDGAGAAEPRLPIDIAYL